MNKKVIEDKLSKFNRALIKLEEAFTCKDNNFIIDVTIKRFEFTFEMS
jgi:hypothetical protein